MDNEIKDMLIKLLEGQTRLELEVSGVKNDISNVKNDLNGVKSDVGNIKNDLNGVKGDISNVKNDLNGVKGDIISIKDDIISIKDDIKKNSIKLDTIEKNINIIAEVQTSHYEQNERAFKNIHSIIEEKTNLIEASVKSVSKDVREVKESIEVLKDMTGRHEVDINILKRRPV